MRDESLTRQTLSNYVDTFRGDDSSARPADEVQMTIAAPELTMPRSSLREGVDPAALPLYRAPMTTANDVAITLRDQLPDAPDRKLHVLLYLAQGLNFAADGKPLFVDQMTATDTSVVVDLSEGHGNQPDDAAQVIIGITVARYGALTAVDLEALVRGQQPWQNARREKVKIVEQEWISSYFREVDEDPDGTVTGFPRSARSQPQTRSPRSVVRPDDSAEIAAFAAEMRARM